MIFFFCFDTTGNCDEVQNYLSPLRTILKTIIMDNGQLYKCITALVSHHSLVGGDSPVISLKMTTNIYKTQFESQQYIRQYYSNVDQEEQFFLTQLHELFSSFQSSSSPLSRPRVVLEIGSGPLVSGLVSASSWVKL